MRQPMVECVSAYIYNIDTIYQTVMDEQYTYVIVLPMLLVGKVVAGMHMAHVQHILGKC